MKTETITLKSNPNVTLTTYLLDTSPEMPNAKVRPAVLVFPGGGYFMCSDREAEPVAMAFLAQGYHAFVLRYSVKENAAFPAPLRDAEEALECIRANAGPWGVLPDKIAVCGFSAGGHLAAALGTMGRVRPNALILGYPVILDSLSHILAVSIPSLEKHVDSQTPPTFIFTTANDSVVPVHHSLKFAEVLDQVGVPFELHIFQDGAHGLSLAKPHTSSGFKELVHAGVAQWVELCAVWLENLFGGFTVEREMPSAKATNEVDHYSVDIPLEVCWSNPECKEVILSYLPGLDQSPNLEVVMPMPLRTLNAYSQALDENLLLELDQKLRGIPFVNQE